MRYARGQTPPIILLVGPRTDTFHVALDTKESYYGLRFWPYAAQPILGDQLERCREFIGPAASILPKLSGRLADFLPQQPDQHLVMNAFHRFAAEISTEIGPVDSVVQTAVKSMVQYKGNVPMSQLADELGISLRQLQRRFLAATGLKPKQFARLRRFRHAIAELLRDEPRPWASVAVDAGYADQSHLVREFTQLIGLSAEELRRKQAMIDHQDVVP